MESWGRSDDGRLSKQGPLQSLQRHGVLVTDLGSTPLPRVRTCSHSQAKLPRPPSTSCLNTRRISQRQPKAYSEFLHDHNRAKDFLLPQNISRVNVGHDRRREERSSRKVKAVQRRLSRHVLSATQDLCSGLLESGCDIIDRFLRDDGAHGRFGIERCNSYTVNQEVLHSL